MSTLSYFSAGTPICIVPSQPPVEIFSQIIPILHSAALLFSVVPSKAGFQRSYCPYLEITVIEITVIPKYSLPHCREHWNRTKDSLGS